MDNNGKIINLSSYIKKPKTSKEWADETAEKAIEAILQIILDEGHDIEDEEFMIDLAIVDHLLAATLNRLEGIEDPNIGVLDDCSNRTDFLDK